MEELKNSFNEMLEVTRENVCSDINKVIALLEDFSRLNFRARLENDNGKIANGINNSTFAHKTELFFSVNS